MDKKRMVIGAVFAMTFVVGWYFLLTWMNKKWPDAAPTNTAQVAPAATQPGAVTPSSQPATAATGGSTSQPTGWRLLASGAAPTDAPPLGSGKPKDETYAMQLQTTSAGAGISGIVLNQFTRSVDDPKKEPYVFQQAPTKVLERFGHPLATRTVTLNGTAVDVSKAIWKLESHDAASATYSLSFASGSDAPVKVLKTYRVYSRDGKQHPGYGYEITLDYDIENNTANPVNVKLSYNGPVMPPRELAGGAADQRVVSGYRSGAHVAEENHYVETFKKEHVTRELTTSENKETMLWTGASSVYFQSILLPPLHAGKPSTASFQGIGLDPDSSEPQPLALVADTVDMTVPANQKLNVPFNVFFGPKHREIIDTGYYASMPRQYNTTLVVRSGPCQVCTFDWLINGLVWMLGAFHVVTRDWGLAIICLVLVVRLALHPITKRSQVSMMKLGKMGPEIKRLQEKYKDDKEELQKAMWQFQKQQGITPVLGCLPMFLQMPIWIALWSALNTTFELRHSSFLWGWTWIHDLAKPDRLIPLPDAWHFRIPLLGTFVDAINLLPILLAGVFYLQQKFNPKPPTMTPEQEQQQKIMQGMMVFLFPLFLYAQPSGLNLYIMTSTGIGIWESKRIRKHIKEKEEAEKAGVVIVDAPPPSKGGKGGGGKKSREDEKPSPGGWLARKFAELQEKADQARRQNDRRGGRDRA